MTDTSTTSVKAATAAITSVTLEVPDPAAAGEFYRAAFGLGSTVRVRASQAPTSGFRGFTLSLVVSQPSTVDALVGGALDAQARHGLGVTLRERVAVSHSVESWAKAVVEAAT